MKVVLTTKDPAEILKEIANEARRQAEGEFSFARTARTQRQVNIRQARGMALKDFGAFIDQITIGEAYTVHVPEAIQKVGEIVTPGWYAVVGNIETGPFDTETEAEKFIGKGD